MRLLLALMGAMAPGPDQDCPVLPAATPPVGALVERLDRGHLILESGTFKSQRDDLVDGLEPILEQTARALSKSPGRFVVFVPAERAGPLPPDTVLGRRRAESAFRRLIAAGSNPERLLVPGSNQPLTTPLTAVVGPCQARIELIRIAGGDDPGR